MVQMRTKSGLHLAWIFFPFIFLSTKLIFLDLFFFPYCPLYSRPCEPPPFPVHVPFLLWAVFPLCPLFVVISMCGQDKGVSEDTVSLWFFSPGVVEVAVG